MITIIEWAIYLIGSLGVLCLLAWVILNLAGYIMKSAEMFWRTCWCMGNWDKVQEFLKQQAREDGNARAFIQKDLESASIHVPAHPSGTNAYVILQDGWSRDLKPKQVLKELLAHGYQGWTRDLVKMQYELLEQEMDAHNEMENNDPTLEWLAAGGGGSSPPHQKYTGEGGNSPSYGELKKRAESMSKNFKGPQP